VHTVPETVSAIIATLDRSGALEIDTANWTG